MTTKQTQKFKKGDTVSWKWGQGTAHGTVKEIYTEKITKTIQGEDITRNATKDEPAYYVEQERDKHVLKSASELHHENK